MKKKRQKLMLSALVLSAVASVLSPTASQAAAKKPKLNKTKVTINLKEGQKVTYTLKIKNATKKQLKRTRWKTSNKKIAVVSKTGVIKPKKAGKVTIQANVEGKILKCKVTINKARHSYYLDDTEEPTCTKDGYDLYRCYNCSATKKKTLKKAGHKYILDDTIEATCQQKGYDLYICDECNAEEKRNIVAGTHHYEYDDTIEATCRQDGYDIYKCEYCSAEEKRNIVKGTHNYEYDRTIEATCIQEGYDIYKCEYCGAENKQNIVSRSTDHDYVYSSYGYDSDDNYYTIYKCVDCGTTYKEY